ncbi:MAG: hypothetical protein LBH62_06835 [Nitrososphaerota archaeon]|jgi:hypothetical protein|nr:hypothetical protein [Nitrososphaerota archaeon]
MPKKIIGLSESETPTLSEKAIQDIIKAFPPSKTPSRDIINKQKDKQKSNKTEAKPLAQKPNIL